MENQWLLHRGYERFALPFRLCGVALPHAPFAADWFERLRNIARSPRIQIFWVPVLLLLAVICIPLPFPTGLPLTVLAVSVLLNHSHRARVRYVRLKRRLKPGSKSHYWFGRIDKLLRSKRFRH